MMKKVWLQIIRFGFRLLYYELAWSYDAVSWFVSLGQWKAWQRTALPFLKGALILELGHGPGHLLLALAYGGYEVIGVDHSPFMGRMAWRRLQQAGFRPNLIRADVRHLPFFAHRFDSILATFPTNDILHPDMLRAVGRLLNSGGRLVIVPAAELRNAGALAPMIEWLYWITGQRVGRKGTEQSFPTAEGLLETALSDAGFSPTVQRVALPRSVVTVIVAEVEVSEL